MWTRPKLKQHASVIMDIQTLASDTGAFDCADRVAALALKIRGCILVPLADAFSGHIVPIYKEWLQVHLPDLACLTIAPVAKYLGSTSDHVPTGNSRVHALWPAGHCDVQQAGYHGSTVCCTAELPACFSLVGGKVGGKQDIETPRLHTVGRHCTLTQRTMLAQADLASRGLPCHPCSRGDFGTAAMEGGDGPSPC